MNLALCASTALPMDRLPNLKIPPRSPTPGHGHGVAFQLGIQRHAWVHANVNCWAFTIPKKSTCRSDARRHDSFRAVPGIAGARSSTPKWQVVGLNPGLSCSQQLFTRSADIIRPSNRAQQSRSIPSHRRQRGHPDCRFPDKNG